MRPIKRNPGLELVTQRRVLPGLHTHTHTHTQADIYIYRERERERERRREGQSTRSPNPVWIFKTDKEGGNVRVTARRRLRSRRRG